MRDHVLAYTILVATLCICYFFPWVKRPWTSVFSAIATLIIVACVVATADHLLVYFNFYEWHGYSGATRLKNE